jgi:hypothetical protein
LRKMFSGFLETPKNKIDVCTVHWQTVLTFPVKHLQSELEIWINSVTEPDTICIIVKV